MLSLQKNKSNKAIAIIEGGKHDKKIIYLDNDAKPVNYVEGNEQLNDKMNKELNIKDGKFFVYPDLTTQDAIYCAGPRGSGKSTFMGQYAKLFKTLFKKRDIILFSKVAEDKALDNLKPIRIPLDERFVEDPMNLEDLKDSLVIFDDVDTVKDKELRDILQHLQDEILELGRHQNIYCINSRHQLLNYKSTRCLLNESQKIVFFPKSGSAHVIKKMLTQYIGLDKQQIDRIFKLNSRWVALQKTYPMHIISEHSIYLL